MELIMKRLKRCSWLDVTKPDYVNYHDNEWGVPVYDDKVFFEFLILESAQAGLNWYTILKRRNNYRTAFSQFDPLKVSQYTPEKINELVQDTGIIRNRKKIEAAVNNAKCFLLIQKEFGTFSDYIWAFVNYVPIVLSENEKMPAQTTISSNIAKDMKKRGFKFIGSTIIYSLMQGCGLVNDHEIDCFKRN